MSFSKYAFFLASFSAFGMFAEPGAKGGVVWISEGFTYVLRAEMRAETVFG